MATYPSLKAASGSTCLSKRTGSGQRMTGICYVTLCFILLLLRLNPINCDVQPREEMLSVMVAAQSKSKNNIIPMNTSLYMRLSKSKFNDFNVVLFLYDDVLMPTFDSEGILAYISMLASEAQTYKLKEKTDETSKNGREKKPLFFAAINFKKSHSDYNFFHKQLQFHFPAILFIGPNTFRYENADLIVDPTYFLPARIVNSFTTIHSRWYFRNWIYLRTGIQLKSDYYLPTWKYVTAAIAAILIFTLGVVALRKYLILMAIGAITVFVISISGIIGCIMQNTSFFFEDDQLGRSWLNAASPRTMPSEGLIISLLCVLTSFSILLMFEHKKNTTPWSTILFFCFVIFLSYRLMNYAHIKLHLLNIEFFPPKHYRIGSLRNQLGYVDVYH